MIEMSNRRKKVLIYSTCSKQDFIYSSISCAVLNTVRLIICPSGKIISIVEIDFAISIMVSTCR